MSLGELYEWATKWRRALDVIDKQRENCKSRTAGADLISLAGFTNIIIRILALRRN